MKVVSEILYPFWHGTDSFLTLANQAVMNFLCLGTSIQKMRAFLHDAIWLEWKTMLDHGGSR